MRRLLAIVAAGATAVALSGVPAAADDEDDEAIAEQALPTLDDLPAGWEETSVDEDTEETGLRECKAIDAAARSALKQPNAESPNFIESGGPTAQVEARVFVFSSAKGAKKYFKAWNADAAEDCVLAIGLAAAEEQAPDAEVTVETLGLEGIGDDVVGRSLILEAPGMGSVYTDLDVARVGRAIVGLGTQDFGGSLPEGLDVLEAVVGRVEEAL